MKAEIDLPKFTPEQVAEMFWDMDDKEQAQFFGSLGAIALASSKGYGAIDMQMCHVSQSDYLTPNGARVMEMIGAFVDGKRLQPLV